MPDLQYTTVNDFRPGIVVNVRPGINTNFNTEIDQPPGTAGPQTTGCYALQSGALCPLPKHASAYDQTFTISAAVHNPSLCRPIGLFTVGPLATTSGGGNFSQNAVFADELHLMVQGDNAGNNSLGEFEWHIRKLYFSAIPSDVITTHIGTGKILHGITGITARLRHATFTSPGLPTFLTEWSEAPITGFTNLLYMYPDPANTTSDTVASQSYGPVQLAILSGRVILLKSNQYAHGASNGVYYTNEDIFYTDPPNSDIITSNAATVLDLDNPSGYMSWGSLTYGELFLVKRDGGALVIDGDIYAPNISILRGVKSAGNLMNVCTPSQTGLVYCVDNDGAYMWEGGNSSRKISTVNDRFYDRVNGNPTTGVQVKHTRWGQFIAFPNGYLFDTLTEAWWSLDTTADIALVESGKGNPNLLWCAPDEFSTPSTCTVTCYDLLNLTNTYTWFSQSISALPGKNIDISEVLLSVSSVPPGGASCVVSIEDATGTFQVAATFNFTGPASGFPQTQRVRMTTGITNVSRIKVRIEVDATISFQVAPTILNWSVGWTPSNDWSQQSA